MTTDFQLGILTGCLIMLAVVAAVCAALLAIDRKKDDE